MKKHLNWISYKGNEILYCDYKNLKKEELIEGLIDSGNSIKQMGKKDLLFIFDVTNTFFDRESFNVAIDFAKTIKPFRKKSTLVGVTGGKKFLLNTLLAMTQTKSYVNTFEKVGDAKEWLVL